MIYWQFVLDKDMKPHIKKRNKKKGKERRQIINEMLNERRETYKY